jgi:hypothetical protein
VVARQARDPARGEQLVERAVGAAVGVGDRDVVVARAEPVELGRDGRRDPLGPVVQQRGDRVHVDVPAAPAGDPAHVGGQRATGDDGRGAHPGNASWSMKRSLKSVRPDSST